MGQIAKGTTYTTGDQVTANNLNALVDNATLLPACIFEQQTGTALSSDYLLACNGAGNAIKKVTATSLSAITDTSGFLKLDGTRTMTADLKLANSTPGTAISAASKGYVDSTIGAVSGVPTGAIIAFYGTSAPTGWLECNGQSTSGYTALAALIGATVPDLRGEFIRGWDHSRGIDSGRQLGTSQTDEFKSHYHLYGSYSNYGVGFQGPGTINAGAGYATSYAGGSETRPRNVALMYIIKT